MKKILLILLVVLGLQTQAQINYCDSLSYTVVPGTQTLTTIGDASPFINTVDSIIWSWQACNSTMCYSGSGDTVSFVNILSTDTVKVCYDAYIYLMGATYICTNCDSLVYDMNSYSWVLMNMGNPTSIKELIDGQMDGQMYDLLGREIFEVPKGTIYIKNRKKYIK
tara:strand:+ start:548 stop:1045 length:498 start_codon:yes stop_codon:yes gene_type:complete